MSLKGGQEVSFRNNTLTAERPVEILQRLILVPGAEEALNLFHETNLGTDSSADLLNTLKSMRHRLLAEASPDYWLEEFSIKDDGVDSHQIDLAVDAAASRLEDATAIAGLISVIENDCSDTPEQSVDADS